MSEQFSEKPADFLAPRHYPVEPPAPPRPVAKPARWRGLQNLLAGLVFVTAVGIATYLKMNSASSGGKTGPVPGPAAKPAALIKFPVTTAKWDPEDDKYALEQEKGQEGHFDFPFENDTNQEAELGLLRRSCDCSHLEVCVVSTSEWERYCQEIKKHPVTAMAGDWTWRKITENELQGMNVPAGAKGFVRVGWNGRKEAGQPLRLGIEVWHQPKGKMRERDFSRLDVSVMIAPPILFSPPRASVGTLGPRDSATAEFMLYSSTRSAPDLKIGDEDPLFVSRLAPFTPEETKQLEKKLRKGEDSTRIKSAFHLKVSVREQAEGGRQMDQGPFYRPVTLVLDDEKINGPVVSGSVKGDVIVGSTEDRGKINLTFRAKEGISQTVPLWTEDDKTVLTLESQTPATLEVNLSRGETVGKRTKWFLKVTVPANVHFGVFPDDSVIILRMQTVPPRFIRIPVVGNGQA
jgi:hypothetical protein